MPYELTEERRDRYRETSIRSQRRKRELLLSHLTHRPTITFAHEQRLDPNDLMPQLESNGLTCLSLFSGGGGLDLGFERAGFQHNTSFEILDICGETLRKNRPNWDIRSGPEDGDVCKASFSQFRGVDIVHGGPPCQPFSIAGKQAGAKDSRNMWPAFVRCVLQVKPRAFIAENVPGMLDSKFESFIKKNIFSPLSEHYEIFKFNLAAHDFGVPQARRRVFFVGFRAKRDAKLWKAPQPTHGDVEHLLGPMLPRNTARKSLGLSEIGFDTVAPTLRSGFTGPRNTTGVVNSKASLRIWDGMKIWPNGVQPTHTLAAAYKPENGHFRLSIEDCAILQGFPHDWNFAGAVYQALGQIGNSVCPPVAYVVARQVSRALRKIPK